MTDLSRQRGLFTVNTRGYYWTVILDVESTTKPLDNEVYHNLDYSTVENECKRAAVLKY